MQKQLLLFHNAVAGYFSGNQTALDATMKQFAIKVSPSHLSQSNSFEEYFGADGNIIQPYPRVKL